MAQPYPSPTVPSGPRRCIDVAPVVPVVSSASRSHIQCRSYSRQLASPASKNLVPPKRECAPCPHGPLLLLREDVGERSCGGPHERPTGAAIPVPPAHGTDCRHNTLVSRDSGDMSSQQGWSFPARFHCMMGPISGSASCPAVISSGVQPGSHL